MKMPTERQAVTIGLFSLAVLLIMIAVWQPDLWKIDAFKTVLQGVVMTGLLNMVAAFHFTAGNHKPADPPQGEQS